MDQNRVTRMRELLSEASSIVNAEAAFNVISFKPADPGIRGPLKRRAIIKQLLVTAKDYDLQLYVDAYLAAADRASLSGLDNQQLSKLSSWVSGVVDRMAIAADSPDSPPAR